MNSTLEEQLDKAWELLEEGDVEKARRIGEKLTVSEAESADVALLLAACARDEGNIERAIELLARAGELDPEWSTPALWTAELLAADESRLAEALTHATRALDNAEEEEEFLEALALKAGLEMDLGKTASARRTLAELPGVDAVTPEPTLAMEFAHLFLAVGDPDEARRRFQAIVDEDPTVADAWHGLGLTAEIQGDEEGKRKAWLETLGLDDRAPLEDPLLTEDEMEQAADEALSELPARARTLIQNVPILISDLPARDDVAQGLDPRLLGLFVGTAHPDESMVGGVPQLTQILLFRKNLERVANDPDELRDEIRTTLLHETGHFFGMDEDDLAGVGLD